MGLEFSEVVSACSGQRHGSSASWHPSGIFPNQYAQQQLRLSPRAATGEWSADWRRHDARRRRLHAAQDIVEGEGGRAPGASPRGAGRAARLPEARLYVYARRSWSYSPAPVREVELTEIEALATTSTVRFSLTNDGIEIMFTSDKDAKKTIVWETTYRIPISSFRNNLELHLIRTSQDLLTNQLTRKTLATIPIEFPAVDVLEKGEGGVDDMTITFMPKGKKKPIAKVTMGWQYRAAPNAYADLDPVRPPPSLHLT